jgi:hypothetical protein
VSTVEEAAKNSAAFVFDLLGNSSVRFEQFDGTTSLPFKSNSKFHLAGKVVVTPPEIFKKVVENITPIIKAKGNKPCIILPPLPRYLFSRCCSDNSHCTNASDPEYSSALMSGFVRLKNDLIKNLVSQGVTDFKVVDSCCVTPCSTTSNIIERLDELKNVTNSDRTHFNAAGYKNLATRTIGCLKTLVSKPKKATSQTTYFWRGFRSRHGSSLPRSLVGTPNWPPGNPVRGGPRGRTSGGPLSHRPRGFHPYRKW